jgi:hypothetical protein
MNALTSAMWLNSRTHCCVHIVRVALAGMFLLAGVNAFAQATVTTLADANHGKAGYKDGNTFSAAQFSFPAGIALDPSGTTMFLADCTNNAVRMITYLGNKTSSYTYSAYVATNGISHPIAIAIDNNTNIYVLNRGTGKNGNILEFNGSYYMNYAVKQLIATNATGLTNATSLALDGLGNIFVTVSSNTVIRVTGGTSTVVGVVTNKFTSLRGVVVTTGGRLAITDAGNNGIWMLDPTGTNIYNNATPFTGFNGAGDVLGSPAFAEFNEPENIAKAGNGILVVADFNNNKIKEIDTSGNVTRIFGVASKYWSGSYPGWKDGTVNPNEAIDPVQARQPYGLAVGYDGTVYDTEIHYSLLREATGTGLPVLPPPAPSAPTIYSITTNIGQVTLTWSAVTGATSYHVKRSTSAGAETTIADVAGTTYTDTNVLGGTTYYYVVSALNSGGESPNSAEASATVPVPPVSAPEIGYVTFLNSSNTSRFYQVSSYDFYNDATIVLNGTGGTAIYYDYGTTTNASLVPDPTSSSSFILPGYQDGLTASQVAAFALPVVAPYLSIKAYGAQSGYPDSGVVQAAFQFKTANPAIIGNNAAQFTVSDITTNAHLYYTIDGSDPSETNGFDLGTMSSNVWNVGFQIQSNTLFKVRAFHDADANDTFQPSAIATNVFYVTNYAENAISFGFASGEASSDFVASPGETFYAPVTLSILSGTVMDSLQFNMSVTNDGPNPGPAPVNVASYNVGFAPMLMKPIPSPTNYPAGVQLYTPIPPFMFIANAVNPPSPSQITNYNGGEFVNLEVASGNLLAVGWLERYTQTNLFDTLSQDLIQYSQAHDDTFLEAGGKIIVGGYSFTVPTNAALGQTYQIQIGRPSATTDGIGEPGSSVLIATPTTGSLSNGPVNAIKVVTLGQRKYLVGDVYPFRWFNAGDFGSGDLVTNGSSDAAQVFEAAVYGLNSPPAGSDFFDAMDSAGSFGVKDQDPADPNYGYFTNAGPLTVTQEDNLFAGDYTTMNQMAFGDGKLDVCDVYVTFLRSEFPGLTWYSRFWNNGVRVADTNFVVNPVSQVVSKVQTVPASSGSTAQPMVGVSSTTLPQVNFTATDEQGTPGQAQQISVPITANIVGSYPVRALMLNLSVVPLDGSPALTTHISFTPNPALGQPTPGFTDTRGYGNYAAAWLPTNGIAGTAGLSGSNAVLGTLSVTIPASATASSAYAIHFDHASASPNGVVPFPKATLTGLITLSSRTNSSYGDGIPDSWRLRWFGTVNNYLSLSNACPSGDGVNNWMKYAAGVDPNTANDFPSTSPVTPTPSGSTMAIHWPSVSGKQYVIMRSSSLFSGSWTAIGTNTGTGTDMEFDDNSASGVNFYRVQIVP